MKVDPRFNDTEFVIEADDFARHTLWAQYSTEALEKTKLNTIRWEEDSKGWMDTVGHVNKMPVCATFVWGKLNGHLVVFYHACSRMVDHAMVEDYLKKYCNPTDAVPIAMLITSTTLSAISAIAKQNNCFRKLLPTPMKATPMMPLTCWNALAGLPLRPCDCPRENQKLRSERRKRIVTLREQGKTIAEIRTILGMDRNNLASTMAQMRKAGTLPCIPLEEAVRRQKEAVRKRGCDPKLILDLHNKGISQDAIAEQLNQKKGYVARILKNVQKQETEQFRNRLIELYNRGISYKSMALILNTTLGCCAVTVNRLVKKGRLTLRGQPKQYEPRARSKQEITEDFTVFPIPLKPTRTYIKQNADNSNR